MIVLRSYILKLLVSGSPIILFLYLLDRVNLLTSILIVTALTLIAYIVGDTFILPATNNRIATAADGALTYFFLWSLSFWGIPVSVRTTLLSVLTILILEGVFFHAYLFYLRAMEDRR